MKGKINVKTENIFPVIKKFLYSDHEIFLREIVSNAVDATQKLKTLSSLGEAKGELGDLTIDVKIDKDKKTLHVIDRGIGMTKDEVEKYITQIAFSGAEEFLEKFKGKTEADVNQLIGHFGLGFFSSFMVSDQVEILTKSFKEAPAVHWTCDGDTEYAIEECDKKERGTEIIMHITEECKDFLEEYKILALLKKYCKFMPVPIRFGKEKNWEDSPTEKDKDGNPKRVEVESDRIINNTEPLWKKSPSELKDEDYTKFFHELYPMNFDDPLFHIHLNVDYPFNLTGVLYFPKVKKNIDPTQDKIQLYCNQVFVTDSVEGVVPQYMMLLRGVLDSPDIPLNVSRSYLQSDNNVKKISSHISKKVAEKLEEISTKQHDDFLKKWDDLKVFIEYGMLSDEKFYDRMKNIYVFKTTEGKDFYTFEDYKKKISALQTDKDGNVIFLYAQNTDEQYAYIKAAKDKGYDVLLMDGILDSHFINMLEQKNEKIRFTRIDSDVISKLIQKDEKIPSKLSEDESKKVKEMMEGLVDKKTFTVQTESLEEDAAPVTITQNEFMRRMKDMSELGGGGMYSLYGDMPDSYNLVINTNHPAIYNVLQSSDSEKQTQVLSQLKDLALLSQGLLKGEALDTFIKRSTKIIE